MCTRIPQVSVLIATILTVLLVVSVACAANAPYFNEQEKQAVKAQAAPQDKGYLVDVGSRVIGPVLGKPLNYKGGRTLVYVQFQRPLKASERGQLKGKGVRFYRAVSSNTYLVKAKPSGVQALNANPLIRGIEPVLPADKLTKALYTGHVPAYAVNADGSWAVYVRFFEDVKLGHAIKALHAQGIKPEAPGRFLFNNRLLVNAIQSQVLSLAEDQAVQSIRELPPPPKEDNAVAAQLSNVDILQVAPFNLDGTDVRIGEWDGGQILTTHQDLTPRVTNVEADNAISSHSTHVCGTMISSGANNANAMGMALNATVFGYDFDDDTTDEQSDAVTDHAIRISNHSWGSIIGWDFDGTNWNDTGNTGQFGLYEGECADYDTLVRDTGLIVCRSAGNDRDDCNPGDPNDCDGTLGADGQRYDTIPDRGVAKNVITVGAINDNGTTITGFSSSGPANDGRIKPDVVANGAGLTSTCEASNSDYCSKSGTSMSCPTVSGICALLVQRYRQHYANANPTPDIIKALLVNTAVDLGRPGPDYLFGYGLVDALEAVDTIDVGGVRIITDAVDNGQTDEFLVAVGPGAGQLRVTLNWIDPEGTTDSGDPDIVNNLDLEVVQPDDTVIFPFTGPGTVNFTNNATATGPNSIDTVEQVVANPVQGFWKVRVKGTSVPAGPQNYALVSNASFSLPDEPDIRVNAPLDFDEVCPGDKQDIQVSIFNIGGADLLVNSVSVVSGGADFWVLPDPAQPFIVQPGAHVDVTVRFEPSSPGPKTGTLRIESNDEDQGVLDIEMTGFGGSPQIDTMIANNGNFGDVCLGTFKDLDLTIVNSGGCDLTVISILSSSAEFQVAGIISLPVVIHAGDSLAVPIRLQPTSLGAKAATITITSDDPLTPVKVVDVNGNTPPGDIRVTGSTDFGDVCPGVLAEKTISICNVGKCNLTVTSVAFEPPCLDFTLVNNPFPAVISPDSCVDVVIRFTPTFVGPKSCTLVIRSDDPDTPVIELLVTGNTPAPLIDVPPDLAFPPTVIQRIGPCVSLLPFPISNTGTCPLKITAITIGGPDASFYSLDGLPSFPIILEPGHIVGEGDLNVAFAPDLLDRDLEATLTVTYVSDPITGATTDVVRALCGEGVMTGARVLVTAGGVPVTTVEKLQIQRINANRNRPQLDTVDVSRNLPLVAVVPSPPCLPFQYHKEYGTVSNPIQLLPGSYQVTATVRLGGTGKPSTKTVGFDTNTCTFNQTIVIDF
ncbi:MAG: choice-of-anchor D domain-containing protein [Armatimonadetes bacterium]|nr:choice-of-anchor D domain-containing protein [Armatimonadota bacterium]